MTELETIIARMTIAELARLGGKSVAEIVAAVVTDGAGVNAASRRQAPVVPDELERGELPIFKVANVLAAAGKPISSSDVRAQVGGSMTQVRAALRKLAEAGRVKITGERRGTRYAAR